MLRRKNRGLVMLVCLATAWLSPVAGAHDSDTSEKPSDDVLGRKFALGIGVGINRFNSSYKFRDQGNLPIFIDGEGNFGLPDTELMPLFYGAWRLTKKHGIEFHYFSINRTGTDLAVDRNFGDLRVSGQVTATDKSAFYYVNYSYTFKEDENIWIKGLIGLYAIDLKFNFEAVGDIDIGGDPVLSGRYVEEINQFAPLPLLGLQFWSRASEKWMLGAKFAMIGGTYKDLKAVVVEGNVSARYQFAQHVGFIVGVNYFNTDIDINDDGEKEEIKYGFDGFFAGLDFNF